MDDLTLGYIAGMIDADGCVTLVKRRSTGSVQPFTIMPLVMVTNSCLPALERIQVGLGCGIIYRQKRVFKPNWTPVHRWQCVGRQAREVLRIVRPLLTVKADATDAVLSLRSQGQGGRREHQAEKFAEQVVILDRVRLLNKRGLKTA